METTLNQHIEVTPGVCGGKPRIAGRRISVADVVIMYLRMGQSLEEIAGKYELSLASVYAAIAYYYDYRSEIDQQMQTDENFVNALMQAQPSRLQARLRELRGE
ncbi:DUF433 domain-containing protein [Myxacorys almedinensis]|uniref:DUF433 domain-containing protein n=1 Tax=Myxacorys almedinensis A TaxID=2690445 RepID=A0A8J7YYE5_9CYAN|nr:DUF433 domain-containing protein [Myxacorys almedinensis]NDJ16897.1 DUF433 domain-containing protein [Myxacorys almedinensis A]